MLKTLTFNYLGIFDSHLNYSCLLLVQNPNSVYRQEIFRKKTIRIINYQPRNSNTSSLFMENAIIKSADKVNIIFISKYHNNLLPLVFNGCFTFASDKHNFNTSYSKKDQLYNCHMTLPRMESIPFSRPLL